MLNRELRDKYETALAQLSEVNSKIAAIPSKHHQHHKQMMSVKNDEVKPGGNTGSGRQSLGGGGTRSGSPSSSSPRNGAAAPPPDFILAKYRTELGNFQRAAYSPSDLFAVPNFDEASRTSTKLHLHLPDVSGALPSDVEWKAICKDRKVLVEELFDNSRTWTSQRDECVQLACSWLERKYPRLGLCDASRWKAVNVIKARFEESRKPITAGGKEGRRESSRMIDPALGGGGYDSAGDGSPKRVKRDIPV